MNTPFLNNKFIVEIDGISRSGFTEVSFFDASTDWIEYREGAHPNYLQKLGGLKRFGVMTLKTGVTDSMELSQWYRSFSDDPSQQNKKAISVIVLDAKGVPAARFAILNAWPVKYAVGPFNAKGKDVLHESLDIVFEEIQRVRP